MRGRIRGRIKAVIVVREREYVRLARVRARTSTFREFPKRRYEVSVL
jgi:hypothetical protein